MVLAQITRDTKGKRGGHQSASIVAFMMKLGSKIVNEQLQTSGGISCERCKVDMVVVV